MSSVRYDAVVIGGGHNGMVAAILLARAGWSVCLLERSGALGGAVAGAEVFDGVPVRLSRYSYLVSLWPDELSRELGVVLPLASRPVASYTPVVRAGRATGLLVERRPSAATEASFRDLTGTDEHWRAWLAFDGMVAGVARAVAPTLCGPLPRRAAVRDAVTAAAGASAWDELVERPLAEVLQARFTDDTVRGVLATDGLIGTATSLTDLRANRCFLYHVVGNGTGEWRVPIGGMGTVADRLVETARAAGVTIRTRSPVISLRADERSAHVVTADGATLDARYALGAIAPASIAELLGRDRDRPVGSQLKLNMVLRRLPRLRSGIDPVVAFAGTMHLEQGFRRLEQAQAIAAAGGLPSPLPCEVYCHSLTDRSLVAATQGYHTLTLFGLHFPATNRHHEPAVEAAMAALRPHLAEPIEDCLATDNSGRPCIEVATPQDLEWSLGMPGGHIFHGDLSWPWLADDEPADSAAQRWGVAVDGQPRVLLAGAGSRRGGGVSGLGGWHAARAALADAGQAQPAGH